MKQFVYLHIPKSGGTTQRTLFQDVYGKAAVYWHGHTRSARSEQALVIGGHREIGFYPSHLDALYLSVVRDPVERIVSLYSYYVRPDLVDGDVAWVSERQRLRERWLAAGMCADSILRSIEHSPDFRREIQNRQCAYLSRFEPTIEGVQQTLESTPMVIGDQAASMRFNQYLSEAFNWGEVPNRRHNRSKADGNRLLGSEPGLVDAVEALASEDFKLYRFIHHEHRGLYSNQPAPGQAFPSLRCTLAPLHVSVYTKGYFAMGPDGDCRGAVVFANQGAWAVNRSLYPRLSIEVRFVSKTGQLLDDSCLHAMPLDINLNPGQKIQQTLHFNLSESLVGQVGAIRIRVTSGPQDSNEEYSELLDGTAVIFPA